MRRGLSSGGGLPTQKYHHPFINDCDNTAATTTQQTRTTTATRPDTPLFQVAQIGGHRRTRNLISFKFRRRFREISETRNTQGDGGRPRIDSQPRNCKKKIYHQLIITLSPFSSSSYPSQVPLMTTGTEELVCCRVYVTTGFEGSGSRVK